MGEHESSDSSVSSSQHMAVLTERAPIRNCEHGLWQLTGVIELPTNLSRAWTLGTMAPVKISRMAPIFAGTLPSVIGLCRLLPSDESEQSDHQRNLSPETSR